VPLTLRPQPRVQVLKPHLQVLPRGYTPTAHTLACLRFAGRVTATSARLATGSGGLTPGRTGFAPAGRQTKFHGVIASSFLFDQPCLVALFRLSADPATSAVRAIAFGSHVDADRLDAARQTGSTDALPRSLFARDLGSIVQTALGVAR